MFLFNLLVFCGDYGMFEIGSYGVFFMEEVNIFLILISFVFERKFGDI